MSRRDSRGSGEGSRRGATITTGGGRGAKRRGKREGGNDRRGDFGEASGITAVLCGKMMETQNYWEDTSAHSMQVKYER